MKGTVTALLGAALLAAPSLAHSAIKPPSPDKALTPNSIDTPEGCKALASDKQWPADDVWKKAFPGVFKKLKGTEAPDFMVQAKTVSDVQNAVNFAREHNVRLSIITTGHDFGGRETARSGLRLDLAALREPTVFSNDWKCGDVLKPTNAAGRVVEEVESCKIPKVKRSPSYHIPARNHEFKFFEKRDGLTCKDHLRLQKRQMEGMEGMSMGAAPSELPQHNTIKNNGKPAYARISAGMYNEMFFDQADKSGYMTLGAQHGGVSVLGGWAQAGGHNPFVNRFGMQVDNLVEIEVVTADGKFQKVSECNNPELFWALRGGGGSTFGVVTGGTVRVFPTFPIAVTRFFVNSTKPGIYEASAHFLQQGAKLRDTYGLQGYFYIYPGGFQSVLHMPAEFATLENAKKATEPLMAEMEKLAGAKHIEPNYYQYKTYKEWYEAEMGTEEMEDSGAKYLSYYDGSDGSVPASSDAMMNPVLMIPWATKYPAGPSKRSLASMRHVDELQLQNMGANVMRSQAMARTYLDSRLLTDKHVNSVSLKDLAGAINATFPRIDGEHVRGFLYGGGEMAKPAKDSMGLLPAWRDMTYHYIINAVPGNIRHDYDIGPMAKLFPDAHGYVNEARPGEMNWKVTYWGDHYEKLEAMKKKVDPTMVFWCSPCVGADILTYDDERLCKNPNYPQAGPAPQTYPSKNSTRGISSLAGTPGIPNPLLPIVKAWMMNHTLPSKMPKSNYFKIAMGEGGSAGGKFADMDPYNPGKKLTGGDSPVVAPTTAPAADMPGMDKPQGAASPEVPNAPAAAPPASGGMGSMPGMGMGAPAASPASGGMDSMPGMGAPVASPASGGMDSMPGMDMGAPPAAASPAPPASGGMDMGGMDMGSAAPAPAAPAPAASASPSPSPASPAAAAAPKPAAPAAPPAPKSPKSSGGRGRPRPKGARPKIGGGRGRGLFGSNTEMVEDEQLTAGVVV